MKSYLIPSTLEPKSTDTVLELTQVLPITDSSGKIVDIFIPTFSSINQVNLESGNIQIELPSERVLEYNQLLSKVYKCSYVSALLARKIGEIYELVNKVNSGDKKIQSHEKLEYFIHTLKNNKLFSSGVKELFFKKDINNFCNRLEAFFIARAIFKSGVPCIIEGDSRLLLKLETGEVEPKSVSYFCITEEILRGYFKAYYEINQILIELETSYKSFCDLFDDE